MAMKFRNIKYGKPHKTVVDGIENKKKTIFSDVDFFNGGEEGYATIEKLASEEFENITKELEKKGKLSPFKLSDSLFYALSLEMSHSKELEELAIKKVQNEFGIPDSVMNKVRTKLTFDIPQDKIYSKQKKCIESFTEEEKSIIKAHVEKRKIQNALMMGAGFRAHSDFKSIKEDLDKIDVKLYPIYQKIMPNISLLIWQMPLENMMEWSFAAGISQLEKNEKGQLSVSVSAIIFPILLHETTKAVLELLFSSYIIDITKRYGEKIAKEIIRQSDVPIEEIEMKRIGPTLWRYLHNILDYIIKHDRLGDYKLISFLINRISLMEPENFIRFMNNIVYDPDAAINEINVMIDEIEDKVKSFKSQEANTVKQFEDMGVEELEEEKSKAVEDERFEDAAKIMKLIKLKTT